MNSRYQEITLPAASVAGATLPPKTSRSQSMIALIDSGVMFVMIGDVAAVVGAVSYVTIDKQIRLPLIPETKPRARFRRVGLHVIAVEILISAGGAPAHVSWTILIDAIVRTRTVRDRRCCRSG